VAVYLNVYDLSPYNDWGHSLGLGAYHTGIEIYGREYSFGHGDTASSGVFEMNPRSADGCRFREQTLLGEVNLSMSDVERVIDRLKPLFPANSYHILSKNCNSFSDALCRDLVAHGIPSYISRLSRLGECCSCCLPDGYRQPAGVPSANGNGNGNSSQTSKLLSSGAAQSDAAESKFVAFQGQGQSLNGQPAAKAANGSSSNGLFSSILSKSDSSSTKRKTTAASSASNGSSSNGSSSTNTNSNESKEVQDARREKVRKAALERLQRSNGSVSNGNGSTTNGSNSTSTKASAASLPNGVIAFTPVNSH
jgi:hypothetical protein